MDAAETVRCPGSLILFVMADCPGERGDDHGNGDYSSTHFPPNVKPADPEAISNNWPLSITFRSDHPGGLYFAMLDGSTVFINDSIDFDTYRFLSTRNLEEPLQEFRN